MSVSVHRFRGRYNAQQCIYMKTNSHCLFRGIIAENFKTVLGEQKRESGRNESFWMLNSVSLKPSMRS